jgi:hypothetical protein
MLGPGPGFNDSLSTRLTYAQRRARYKRGAMKARATNRQRIKERAEQSTAPSAPAPPTPRQVLDPLSSPAEHLVQLQLAQARRDEAAWRERTDAAIKREREFYQKFGTEPKRIPRRWRQLPSAREVATNLKAYTYG